MKQRGTTLPALQGWNPDLPLLPHQQTAVAWAYLAGRGILADAVGVGKTPEALGLVVLCRQRGQPFRTLVLCEKSTQKQWAGEIARFTDLRAALVRGPREIRRPVYARTDYDVLICTYPLMQQDYELLRALHFDIVIFDEASVARHHSTKTALLMKSLSRNVNRILSLDATPLQNSLLDLHSQFEVLHSGVFGSQVAFERRYVRREQTRVQRGRKMVTTTPIVGYRNMAEFRARAAPFILRRRAADIAAHIPDITVENVWLELSPEQRAVYDEVRRGIATLYLNGERTRFRAIWHHVQLALDTTACFGHQPGASAKLDWLVAKLCGDLRGDSVIVFSRYKQPIADAVRRLRAAGLRCATFTGDDTSEAREQALTAFNSGQVPILIGTTAIEKGLNLQRSAYMITINQIQNPQRQRQLAGRIQRLGSAHAKVFLVNLLTSDTVEERLQAVLAKRAAVSDYVFDEENELFEGLSDQELYALIQE